MGDGALRPVGETIGASFGGVWWCLGSFGFALGWRVPLALAGLLAAIVLIARLWRTPRRPVAGAGPGAKRFDGRVYVIAVAFEAVAITGASYVLFRYGLSSHFIPAVGVIVGLHFIGLWMATGRPVFLWIAGGMCAVSALSSWLPVAWNGFDPRLTSTGIGNALVLWFGSAQTLKNAAE